MRTDPKPRKFLLISIAISSLLIIAIGILSKNEVALSACLSIPTLSLYFLQKTIKKVVAYRITDLHWAFWWYLSIATWNTDHFHGIPLLMWALFTGIIFARKKNYLVDEHVVGNN